jgi:hypothetical protein
MRYTSLIGSTVVLLGLAACRGNDSGMSADLAKDLSAAKTSDALALAPHAGAQQIVSAEEQAPHARTHRALSSKASRPVARHAPHREPAPARSAVVAEVSAPDPAPAPTEVATAAPAPVEPAPAPSPRPEPVGVSYPGRDQGSARGTGAGGTIGTIIGVIGGVVLRGGVADGDHCDPRGRHGGILINQRGPIFRGHF